MKVGKLKGDYFWVSAFAAIASFLLYVAYAFFIDRFAVYAISSWEGSLVWLAVLATISFLTAKFIFKLGETDVLGISIALLLEIWALLLLLALAGFALKGELMQQYIRLDWLLFEIVVGPAIVCLFYYAALCFLFRFSRMLFDKRKSR